MKSLNKTLRALSYFLVLCVTLSCHEFEEVSMGLPSTITLQPEGGEVSFQADRVPLAIMIDDGDRGGTGCLRKDAIEDTARVSYKWLTVKQNVRDAKMIFSAEPTNSTKTRKLRIELQDDPYLAHITIKQKGKVE